MTTMNDLNGSATQAKNVHAAIIEVMGKVPYLKKTTSKALGYSYTSEAELMKLLHPAITDAGLAMAPEDYDVLCDETYQTAKGTPMRRVMVKTRYTLWHAPSGTSRPVCGLGEASDSSDKATGKALTMAYKYALRQTFAIETGDEDPDARRPQAGAHRDQWYQGILAKMQDEHDPAKLREWKARAANPKAGFSKDQYEELSAKIDAKLSAINKSQQPA